ncbi:hypothetical protein [Nocardia salmonicida]|uniref:hypothetical protein n=1 Tax=Nocardia salmonicida TaxID=53431 RepID=UPI00362B428C
MTGQQLFLRDLMRDHEHLREDPAPARPLYRERSGKVPSGQQLTQVKAIERMIGLIHELDRAGYFDGLFGVKCRSTSREPGPAEALSNRLEVDPFKWPMEADHFTGSVWTGGHDEGLFYDVVEYLHDHAARPRHSSWHSIDWDNDCEHYYDYDVEAGQTVYRWRMNKILERSEIDLRLASTGPDIGTLVSTPPDCGRAELLDALAARPDDKEHDADDVQRAISLFLNRSAGRSDKRAAISLLYRALERRRRNVVASALNGADSEPLYMIANKYDLRHNKADQHRDYPDYYLDWVFWMYLSTIELTNRVIDDQATTSAAR